MTTFTNEGTLNLHNNLVDGLQVGPGTTFKNSGKINAERNVRNGIYVVGEAAAALRRDIGQMEEFLAMPSLTPLREGIAPLLADTKAELEKPQPNSSIVAKSVSAMKDFLAKATGSAAGTMAISGLEQLMEHAHTVAAHL